MSKLYIKLTPGTKGSGAMKRVAQSLTNKLGYKVYRTLKTFPKKKALHYGPGVDKITQYKWFAEQGLSSLEYTTNTQEAQEWVNNGFTVFGRKLINASCGKGIHIFEGDTTVMPCPVYTKYKKKKREFRVHIYKGTVVRVVEKKKRSDWQDQRETKVRNLANGYVFCSCDSYPEGLTDLALKASQVTQSDFAGVDVGYNAHYNQLFVIEVNSSPGIEGSNVDLYVNTIISKETKNG